MAELAFFDQDSINITGTYIGDNNVYNIHDAFDGDWLTYSDSKEPDGNWIGMDFKQPTRVSYIRIVPRGDDNYIRVGDTYELKIWDGNYWLTVDKRIADDNCLHYKNMIENCLYWIDNKTRGWDERPFIVESNGEISMECFAHVIWLITVICGFQFYCQRFSDCNFHVCQQECIVSEPGNECKIQNSFAVFIFRGTGLNP